MVLEAENNQNFNKLEDLLEKFSLKIITDTITRNKNIPQNTHDFFINAIPDLNKWTLDCLKIMIAYAITHEKLFDKIP